MDTKNFALFTTVGKGILGELDEDGVVTFAVEAGEGSSIRGTEMFDQMMRHFGDKVRGIQGVWRKGPQGRPSTNIDKVNELTGQGMPLDEALAYAWTVTRAKRWGFGQVSLLGLPEGLAGAFTKIDVLIEKGP